MTRVQRWVMPVLLAGAMLYLTPLLQNAVLVWLYN